MPAETYTLSSFNYLLKRFDVLNDIQKQYKSPSVLLDRIDEATGTVTAEGREMKFPLEVRGMASYLNKGETDRIPESDALTASEATVTVTEAWSRVRITERAKEASASNKGAWAKAQAKAMSNVVERFGVFSNHELYMDGSNVLARVNTTVTSTTFVVDDNQAAGAAGTFGIDYLAPGMRVTNTTTIPATTIPDGTSNMRITSLARSTLTVTFDGSVGDLADNDSIILGSLERPGLNKAMNGLLAALGSVTNTYQGIDRSVATNEWWLPNLYTGTGATPLENKIETVVGDMWALNGAKVTLAICSRGVRKAYFTQLVGDRRFNKGTEDPKYKGGFTSLQIATPYGVDISLVVDRDCPKTMLFLLDLETFKMLYTPTGSPRWFSHDGKAGPFYWVQDYAAAEASYRTYRQLICTAPNRNALLTGITEVA